MGFIINSHAALPQDVDLIRDREGRLGKLHRRHPVAISMPWKQVTRRGAQCETGASSEAWRVLLIRA